MKKIEDYSTADLENLIDTLAWELQKAEGQLQQAAHRIKICAGELYHARIVSNEKKNIKTNKIKEA